MTWGSLGTRVLTHPHFTIWKTIDFTICIWNSPLSIKWKPWNTPVRLVAFVFQCSGSFSGWTSQWEKGPKMPLGFKWDFFGPWVFICRRWIFMDFMGCFDSWHFFGVHYLRDRMNSFTNSLHIPLYKHIPWIPFITV